MTETVTPTTIVRVRMRARYLCTVPKVTAILDVAGVAHASLLTIARRPGDRDSVWVTPNTPTSWGSADRSKIIDALFLMGLNVHVHATDARGRGGHVEFQVVPGGWLGDAG